MWIDGYVDGRMGRGARLLVWEREDTFSLYEYEVFCLPRACCEDAVNRITGPCG